MNLPGVRSPAMDTATRPVFSPEDRTYIRRTPLPAHVVAIDFGVEPELIQAVRNGRDPRWETCPRCGGDGGRFDALYIESGCLACDGVGVRIVMDDPPPTRRRGRLRALMAWWRG